MEIEIRVGEYVRTKNGLIGKVNKIELKGSGTRFGGEYLTDTIIQLNDGKVYERRIKDNYIVNHSKNIIDLIELGDFVNGIKVNDISNIQGLNKTIQKCLLVNIGDGYDIINEEIKTVLTKEQYERDCYKIN